MRYFLNIVLGAAVLLVALWSLSSVFYFSSLSGQPTKAITLQSSDTVKSAVLDAFSSLNASLSLNPSIENAWYSRSKLIELSNPILPAKWQSYSWEGDLSRAIVRSPADVSPILRSALTCAAGYSGLVPANNRCDILFKAVLERAPQYGYAHFRFAEYLYSQVIGNLKQRQTVARDVCKNYGQALSKLADTRLLKSWHENRAFYNCINLASDINQTLSLGPTTKRQWFLMGQEFGRKYPSFWIRNQGAALAYLRAHKAPLGDYDGLANGLAKTSSAADGAAVLYAYTTDHPQDGLGWETFIRYLDKNKDSMGPESVESALIEANQKANLDLSSGLYLLGKACHLKNQVLAGSIFGKLVTLDRDNTKVYAAMARCQFSLGYMMKSIDYYHWSLRFSPGSPKLHIELGRVYAANKQFDKAIDEFQKALDLKPDDKVAKREMRRMGIYEK